MNQLMLHDLAALELYPSIIGIDEAGRGCLAGPVVVAAVRLDYSCDIPALNDSKQLTALQREKLYDQILSRCVAHAVVEVSHQYIDAHNILQATLHGMRLAAEKIAGADSVCYIDGNQVPAGLDLRCIPVVKGDGIYACIAAASILAKVHRDALMSQLHDRYPQYGFDHNKGYGSKQHLDALSRYGPCPIHRVSYAPVSMAMLGKKLKTALKITTH